MVRTPSFDKNGMKKGTWTAEEDRKLVAYVTRYGCWNWRQLPRFAGLKRCGKSCRLRWLNYLRPNLKRGNYTKEEEETIVRLHQSMGKKWSTIAAQLPGRTDNEVKNHWHTHLKKRLNNGERNQDGLLEQEPEQDSSDFMESRSSEFSERAVSTVSSDRDLVATPNHSIGESSYKNDVLINDTYPYTKNDDPFEAYSGLTDDFWMEPFVTDDFYASEDLFMASSLMRTEFLSQELDTNYLLFTEEAIFHDHAVSQVY